MLSRIASLHPNRRTPPPPPPRKKSKALEMEERWEEEMIVESGVEAWAVLGDDERRDMRRAKWARELGRCLMV